MVSRLYQSGGLLMPTTEPTVLMAQLFVFFCLFICFFPHHQMYQDLEIHLTTFQKST